MTKLFSDFSPADKDEWLQKIRKDFKSTNLDHLSWDINSHILISPFVHRSDVDTTMSPLLRSGHQWERGVPIKVDSIETANRQALAYLKVGATALSFQISDNIGRKDLANLLEGIQLTFISTQFILSRDVEINFMSHFISFCEEKGFDRQKVACSILVKEKSNFSIPSLAEYGLAWQEKSPIKIILGHSKKYHSEDIEEEIGELIFRANLLIRQLKKIDPNHANLAELIGFSLTMDDLYHLNIAKIRALRILWQLVLQSWQLNFQKEPFIETWIGGNGLESDKNLNKIKYTTQSMAAVIGGSDRIFIDASSLEEDPAESKRISLHIQHLLVLESHFDRVTDPAAGSYYIESLTDIVGKKAWHHFQKREDA